MKIISFLKSHWVVVFLGVLLVCINLYPQFIFEYKLGSQYRGIERIVSDDENYYQARGRDIIEGHYHLGNPYIFELKDKPAIQFFVPDFIIAKSLSWTGLDILQIFFVYDIILSFFAVILTYACLLSVTKSKFWSLAGVLILDFGMFFYFFNRPISPQFVFMFFLSLFFFILRYIQSDLQDKKYLYLAVANFGALFYLYTYYWTFYFVLLSILVFLFAIQKNKKMALSMLSILGCGTFIGSYYLYSTWLNSKIPEYEETLTRLGMIHSHFPSGLAMVVTGSLLMLGYLYWFYKTKKLDSVSIFMFSGIVTGVVVINQHIITGVNLAFTVHYFLPVFYWFVLSIIYLLAQIPGLSKKQSLALAVSTYIIIFYISWSNVQITTHVIKYVRDFSRIGDEELYVQNYRDVFDWLNKNTNKEDVVLSNESISNAVAVYTHNNIFYSRMSNLHFMSDSGVLERFLINNYFDEVNKDYVIKNFSSVYGTRYWDIYGHDTQVNKVRTLFGMSKIPTSMYPEEQVNKVLDEARIIKKTKYSDLLNLYRVDYVVWDKTKNPGWKISQYSFLERKYWANNIEVYKFIK